LARQKNSEALSLVHNWQEGINKEGKGVICDIGHNSLKILAD